MKKFALKDVCEIIPGYAFKASNFGTGNIYVVKIKDINPPYINIENCECVSVEPDERFSLQKGDFVMAMTGATIGKIGKLWNSHKKLYINQRVCKFLPLNCVKDYLYYLLNTNSFITFVRNNVDSKLAQPNIGHPTLYKFEHLFPSIEEQQSIANVLSQIDIKIYLNEAINHNLLTPDHSLRGVKVRLVA